jgi:cytochrome P450
VNEKESNVTGSSNTAGVVEQPLCPFVEGRPFDPLEPDQVANPFPWLALARREAPVFYMPKYEMWCVTRHEDVVQVVRDVESFSSANAFGGEILIHPDVADELPDGHPEQRGLVAIDPPEHTRLRRLGNKVFTPKLVAVQEGAIREIADELIDGFVEAGRVDLCAKYSGLLSSRVMMRFLGAPLDMTEQVMNWTHDGVRMMSTGAKKLSDEDWLAHSRRAVEWERWLTALIDERRAAPAEDLVSLFVHATDDNGQPALAHRDLLGQISGLIAAGVETTTSFIALLVGLLLTHVDQWEQVKADQTLIPQAVEEGLRLVGPIRGFYRYATVDKEVGGTIIPKGSIVYVHYGSPGRDEAVFSEPDVFDLRRPNASKHLAFGYGTHFCLGAPLARLEARIALECLIDRLPTLRLAEPIDDFELHMQVGSPKTVIVEWAT